MSDSVKTVEALRAAGALRFRFTEEQGLVCIHPYIYTWAVQCHNDPTGYKYRFCYRSLRNAVAAAEDWEREGWRGEPKGYIKRKPEVV